jgi:hypothetical protein
MADQYNIGVKLSGSIDNSLKKSINELQAEIKNLQNRLGDEFDLSAIADLNLQIKAAQAEVQALKSFTGLGTPFVAAQENANDLSDAIATIISKAAEAGRAIGTLSNAKPITDIVPPLAALSASEAAMQRLSVIISQTSKNAAEAKGELSSLSTIRFPLGDVEQYRAQVARLKQDLATGFAPQISQTQGANTAVSTALKQDIANVNQLNTSLQEMITNATNARYALIAASQFQSAGQQQVKVVVPFDEIAAGQAAIARLNESINQLGVTAAQSTVKLMALGNARFPLTSINAYAAKVFEIKKQIDGGLTPKLTEAKLDPRLSPRITADLKKSLVDLENQARRFREGMNLSKSTESITRYGRALAEIEKRMATINKAAGKGANAYVQLAKSSDTANYALTNVGRVIQDAPFGLLGISNNINPLVESFQRLQLQAKETGKSVSSLIGKSLVGFGGIGLAVSAITFAAGGGITQLKKFFAQFGDANEDITNAKKFLEELKDSMDIRFEAVGSVQGEIAEVQALINVVKDETAAKNDRLAAIQRLTDINESYFGDLTLEKNSLAQLTKIQEDYTNALIAQAAIKGFSDEISKSAVELFKQKQALKEAAVAQDAAKQNLRALQEEYKNFNKTSGINLNVATASAADARIGIARDEVNKTTKVYQQLLEVVGQNETASKDLKNALQESVNESLKLKPLTDNKPGAKGRSKADVDPLKEELTQLKEIQKVRQELIEEAKKPFRTEVDATGKQLPQVLAEQTTELSNRLSKAQQDAAELLKTSERIFQIETQIAIRDQAKNKISQSDLDAQLRGFQQDYQKALDAYNMFFEVTANLKTSYVSDLPDKTTIAEATGLESGITIDTPLTIYMRLTSVETRDAIKNAKKELDRMVKEFKDMTARAVSTGLSGIGEGIGNLVSGDGATGFIEPFLNALADGLVQLGRATIEYGVKLLLLKKTFEATRNFLNSNPAVLIVAGVAAVAAGVALRNSYEKKAKFADGGVAQGPLSGYDVELHGREMIIPIGKLNGMPTHSDKTGAGVVILPSLEIRGDRLRVMLKNIEKQKQRS